VEITIKTLDGEEYQLNVNTDITIGSLKTQIAAMTTIPVDMQKLVFNGYVLDDNKALKDYKITDASVIILSFI
jgi:hypothetical protein